VPDLSIRTCRAEDISTRRKRKEGQKGTDYRGEEIKKKRGAGRGDYRFNRRRSSKARADIFRGGRRGRKEKGADIGPRRRAERKDPVARGHLQSATLELGEKKRRTASIDLVKGVADSEKEEKK